MRPQSQIEQPKSQANVTILTPLPDYQTRASLNAEWHGKPLDCKKRVEPRRTSGQCVQIQRQLQRLGHNDWLLPSTSTTAQNSRPSSSLNTRTHRSIPTDSEASSSLLFFSCNSPKARRIESSTTSPQDPSASSASNLLFPPLNALPVTSSALNGKGAGLNGTPSNSLNSPNDDGVESEFEDRDFEHSLTNHNNTPSNVCPGILVESELTRHLSSQSPGLTPSWDIVQNDTNFA